MIKNILNLALLMAFAGFGARAQNNGTRQDAGINGAQGATSGFYEAYTPVNYPAGASEWWHLLDIRHSNPANNFSMQFAGSFFDQHFWARKTNNNPATPWSRLLVNFDEMANLKHLMIHGTGATLNAGDAAVTGGNLTIHASTGGRHADRGAAIEFAIPTGVDGGNLWGQGRIITVAGNALNGNAVGKMILGTRRSFDKYGSGAQWYYGDDVVIDAAGNVGIGSISPPEKLSVNGKILATEVKVASVSNWPDYVFALGYRRPGIRDIEAFIKRNGHLPEMPTAATVARDGIALAEMNRLLLKKVEEMTLHLIEKENELDQLKGKVSDQQALLDEIFKRLNKIENPTN